MVQNYLLHYEQFSVSAALKHKIFLAHGFVGRLHFLTRLGRARLESRLYIKFMCVTDVFNILGPGATWDMFFSWQMAEFQETKPNHLSTLKPFTHPLSDIPLSKPSHVTKPSINGGGNKQFPLVGSSTNQVHRFINLSEEGSKELGKFIPSTIWEILLCQSCINCSH